MFSRSLLKFSLGDVMKLKLVGVCLQLARDLGSEVVGANSDQGRVDQTSIGGGDGVWSGNSVGKGSTVGEDLKNFRKILEKMKKIETMKIFEK